MIAVATIGPPFSHSAMRPLLELVLLRISQVLAPARILRIHSVSITSPVSIIELPLCAAKAVLLRERSAFPGSIQPELLRTRVGDVTCVIDQIKDDRPPSSRRQDSWQFTNR